MFTARLTVGSPRLAWAAAGPGPKKEGRLTTGRPKLACWAEPRPCNVCWVDGPAAEVTYDCWPPPLTRVAGCYDRRGTITKGFNSKEKCRKLTMEVIAGW